MTTIAHPPDWKVTPAHRILVVLGWVLALGAFGFGVMAVILGTPRLWGTVAALAVFAMGLGVTLPEPVPRDMLTGTATRVSGRD